MLHNTFIPDPASMAIYQEATLIDAKRNLDLGHHVILDRSWPSELVYTQALKREEASWYVPIKARTESLDPIYVFLEREGVELVHSDNKDTKHPYTKRTFTRIVRAYKELAAELQGDFFFKDRTHVIDPILTDVIVLAERLGLGVDL